jgi:hypothetical protein
MSDSESEIGSISDSSSEASSEDSYSSEETIQDRIYHKYFNLHEYRWATGNKSGYKIRRLKFKVWLRRQVAKDPKAISIRIARIFWERDIGLIASGKHPEMQEFYPNYKEELQLWDDLDSDIPRLQNRVFRGLMSPLDQRKMQEIANNLRTLCRAGWDMLPQYSDSLRSIDMMLIQHQEPTTFEAFWVTRQSG